MSASEQARADAMADAETFRKVARSPIYRAAWGGYLEFCANNALTHLRRPDGWYSESWARAAAHVAFCAVPGLRGDATR